MIPKLGVGTTTYTWKIDKSDSVYETVYLAGIGIDGTQKMPFGTNSIRYNFAGGKYGTMKALGGQRHHMPSSQALKATGILTTYNGPCIRMIKNDHYRTASYGSTESAVTFREKEVFQIRRGKFLAAQQFGVKDIKKLFVKRYNTAINEMISYTKRLGFKS